MLQQSCHMFCSVQIHALGSIALSYNIVNDRVFQRERLLKTGRNLHPMSITSPFQPTNAYAVQVRTPYCRVSPVNGHIESTQRAWEMRHHPEDGRGVALLLLCKRRISGVSRASKGYSCVGLMVGSEPQNELVNSAKKVHESASSKSSSKESTN